MADFNLKILGTASAIPALGRNLSAQIVHYGKVNILIDCGEGTQATLIAKKHRFHKITHILISHLHGDHYLGLPGLISTMSLNNRDQPLYLFGPKGIQEILTVNFKHAGVVPRFPIHFYPLPDCESPEEIFENEELQISTFPLEHRVRCHGFLIKEKPKNFRIVPEKLPSGIPFELIKALKEGKEPTWNGKRLPLDVHTLPPKKQYAYAYCTDTMYHEAIVPWIFGADLLYHEATFMKRHEEKAHATGHSTTQEAAQIAKLAEVGKLIIGHYSMRYANLNLLLEEAQKVFPNTELAIEGDTHNIAGQSSVKK